MPTPEKLFFLRQCDSGTGANRATEGRAYHAAWDTLDTLLVIHSWLPRHTGIKLNPNTVKICWFFFFFWAAMNSRSQTWCGKPKGCSQGTRLVEIILESSSHDLSIWAHNVPGAQILREISQRGGSYCMQLHHIITCSEASGPGKIQTNIESVLSSIVQT